MNNYTFLLMGALLLGCAQISPTETETSTENSTVEEKELLSLSYRDEDFEERFQKNKARRCFLRKEDNSFYSPLSPYLALSMLKEGARGESLKELREPME